MGAPKRVGLHYMHTCTVHREGMSLRLKRGAETTNKENDIRKILCSEHVSPNTSLRHIILTLLSTAACTYNLDGTELKNFLDGAAACF